MKPASPEGTLLGLNQIVSMDRWQLESRSRTMAHPLYLGSGVALCRIMGRFKLYVSTSDVGFGAHVMLDGLWESWLTVFMARIIKSGMSVVDVGANHGYYTVLFADLVGPQGRVAAIEPHPETARLLRRSVDVNGFGRRVAVMEQAAGLVDGAQVTLHMPDGEPKNARVVGVGVEARSDRVRVVSGRLDTLLADWPRVDFLKIDVEGAEEAAIGGLSAILDRDRPKLLLEFNALRCTDAEGLIDRLSALYGQILSVDFNSHALPVSRETLLDRRRTEDWILYLSRD